MMKINTSKADSGNALIVVLMTVLVIAVVITSYLALVSNQNMTVARSTAWNQAIPVLESGIEEALTQLHYCYTNNLTTNNWTLGTDGAYHKTRVFSDGSYYSVSIIPTNPPTILSTGYVIVPFTTTSPTNYVSRRVKVTTQLPSVEGIIAKGSISLSGGATIDSFNSSNSLYSTGGMYDPTKREANAEVLTDSGAVGAIAVGTGEIYGKAITGPTGTVTGNAPTGGTANNANVQLNDVAAPFVYGTGITPVSSNYLYLGTNYTYLLNSGNYNMPGGINISGGKSMLITGTPTVLYVNGSFDTSGSGFIYVAPGASLKMYLAGTGTFSGSAIVNGGGYAGNVYVYGLTNCNTLTFSGSSAFAGVVDAPDADFTYSGSAAFSGAISANTVLISGSGGVHYDESLNSSSAVVMSWNEF